jgi:L-lactate utilization protein LutB
VHGSFEVQPEEGKRTCHCPTCQRMCPVGPPLPRLICSIHGQQQSGNYDIEASIAKGGREWTRAAHFDNYCQEKMRL